MSEGIDPAKVTLRDKAKLLVGRKIVKIKWNAFRTGRDGWSTDPLFVLDNGTHVRFVTDETEIGEYGIDVCVYPQQKGAP